MLGTFVNVGTIIVGTLVGVWLKKGIKEEYQSALFTAMGFAATALGINAIAQHMPNSSFPVLFIVSLALGGLVGTIVNIHDKFNSLLGRFGQSELQKACRQRFYYFVSERYQF